MVPIQGAARQAGNLQTHDQSYLAQAHLRDQALKAGAVHRGGTGLAQVLVNHDNPPSVPAQRQRSVAQGILASGTFRVFYHLVQGTLAHIQHGLPLQMPCGHVLQGG